MSVEPAPRPRLRRRLRAPLLRGAVRALGLAPETWLRAGCGALARPLTHTTPGKRALANLELVLGDETSRDQRTALARATLRHSARLLAEWARLARGARGPHGAWIDERVCIDPSVAHLDEVLRGGRGALVVTGHIGNWELLAAALRRRGHDGAVIGRHNRRDPASSWMIDMRRGYDVTTMPQDSSPREVLRVLQSGAVLGALCDLEVRRLDGEFIDFLGTPALTMTAPAALARAGRTCLLPARCVLERRERDDSPSGLSLPAEQGSRYRLVFDEPLELDPALGRAEAMVDILRRLNETYERWIRATPEQWAWHQPRWRTRPGDFEARPLGSTD